jgi:hypothetical protein
MLIQRYRLLDKRYGEHMRHCKFVPKPFEIDSKKAGLRNHWYVSDDTTGFSPNLHEMQAVYFMSDILERDDTLLVYPGSPQIILSSRLHHSIADNSCQMQELVEILSGDRSHLFLGSYYSSMYPNIAFFSRNPPSAKLYVPTDSLPVVRK